MKGRAFSLDDQKYIQDILDSFDRVFDDSPTRSLGTLEECFIQASPSVGSDCFFFECIGSSGIEFLLNRLQEDVATQKAKKGLTERSCDFLMRILNYLTTQINSWRLVPSDALFINHENTQSEKKDHFDLLSLATSANRINALLKLAGSKSHSFLVFIEPYPVITTKEEAQKELLFLKNEYNSLKELQQAATAFEREHRNKPDEFFSEHWLRLCEIEKRVCHFQNELKSSGPDIKPIYPNRTESAEIFQQSGSIALDTRFETLEKVLDTAFSSP